MAWLADDLAGAAFGPWGLAVALGVGVGVLAAKRLAPAVAGTAAGVASGVAAGAASTRDRVRGGVTSRVHGLRGWWNDVYAEAYTEWQQGHAGTVSAAAAGATAAGVARNVAHPKPATTTVARAGAPRVRAANGRYVKSETA